ncbi:hypothetical protein SDC9_197078 [bioreactor metagenome]|uniref:Uncharacterized protein n=1 Tax=bioreactor metagenome TaxID=1076179 RepID=A0A645IDX1_9ZZZZ
MPFDIFGNYFAFLVFVEFVIIGIAYLFIEQKTHHGRVCDEWNNAVRFVLKSL